MYTRNIRIFSVSLWLGTWPLFAIAQIKFHGHVIDRKGRRGTGRVNLNFNRKSLNPSFFTFYTFSLVAAIILFCLVVSWRLARRLITAVIFFFYLSLVGTCFFPVDITQPQTQFTYTLISDYTLQISRSWNMPNREWNEMKTELNGNGGLPNVECRMPNRIE